MKSKPLGQKSYGSIPHLPGSRLGPGDHTISEGQARILTERVRDKHDTIIVQEKLDGSNVAVARHLGELIPLNRAGYHAGSSPWEQHHAFAAWVARHAAWFAFLDEGERVCGEWLAQAHGTRYVALRDHSVFVAFDLMRGTTRAPFVEFFNRVSPTLRTPPVIALTKWSVSIDEALREMGEYGRYGAIDPAEGLVYRCERDGAVEFLAKYVRPGKVDGAYFPEANGGVTVWNWQA